MWRTEIGVWPRVASPRDARRAAPSGPFGDLRQLASDGIPGDVAIRSDGASLAVWRSYGRLRALCAATRRRSPAPNPTDDPVASFRDGHPRVEWKGTSSVRAKP